jgi:hypothetical protein
VARLCYLLRAQEIEAEDEDEPYIRDVMSFSYTFYSNASENNVPTLDLQVFDDTMAPAT